MIRALLTMAVVTGLAVLLLAMAAVDVSVRRQIEYWIFGTVERPACVMRLDATALNDRSSAGVTCHGWLGPTPAIMLVG